MAGAAHKAQAFLTPQNISGRLGSAQRFPPEEDMGLKNPPLESQGHTDHLNR